VPKKPPLRVVTLLDRARYSARERRDSMTNPSRITRKRKRADGCELVLLWNCVCPINTAVAIKLDASGIEYASRTRSGAWVRPDGEPVVEVHGASMPLCLRQVRVLHEGDALPMISVEHLHKVDRTGPLP
jgi:hypothetical protein